MSVGLDAILIAAAGWHNDTPGGANRLPTDFARHLARRGRRVAYLCPAEPSSHANPEVVDGVELWRYPTPKASSPSFVNLLAHLRNSGHIAGRIAARSRVRAVLGHAPLQYLGALARLGDDVRRCYGVHSPFVEEWRSNFDRTAKLRAGLALPLVARLESLIFSKSDVIHCDSQYCLELIRAEHPALVAQRGIVLPGWVDTERFTPTNQSRRELRKELGSPWNSSEKVFFTLRRLVPRMGLMSLIEATAALSHEGYEFTVIIGGDGPERKSLEYEVDRENLCSRVFFLGRISEEKLVDCFRAADCFVLPTRSLECFGLIVLEAYACGIPVIGVPVGSIPEVMGEQFSLWIARDNSARALADKMRDFLLRRLAVAPEHLRHRSLQFGFETMARKHESTLLGNNSPNAS